MPIFVQQGGKLIALDEFLAGQSVSECNAKDQRDAHLQSQFGFCQPSENEMRRRRGLGIDAYTYFAVGRWTGRIKIGRSNEPWRRVTELIRANNGEESALAVTLRGGEFERAYHDLFAEHADGNEWFNPAPEILSEIARLKAEGREEYNV